MYPLTVADKKLSGSVLIVCMVFLAALSMMAITAIEVSGLGQKMIFAYAQHGSALRDAEGQLVQTERDVWQQLDTLGLAATVSHWSNGQGSANSITSAVFFSAQWTQTEFSVAQCGLLFRVLTPSTGGALQIGSHWRVCCENRQDCEQANFLSRYRQWQRITAPLD